MGKKLLAALLAALMVLSLATACQSGGDTSSDASEPVSSGEASKAESSEAPKAGVDLSTKRDIEIVMQSNTFITSYDDNDLTEAVEKDLNCNIEFNMLPAGSDALAKLQLMINSGEELADVIAFNLTPALRYQYGNGGSFIPLNDYFDNKDIMPNYNAIESEEDKMAMQSDIMSADGNIYSLAMFQPELWNMTPYRIYMNMQWLDNLGLEVPKTTDELKDVLIHFANDDPNGNGVRDEVPVLAFYIDNGGYGTNIIQALIHSFVYVGNNMSSLRVSDDGKTVMAAQLTDEYREAMKYLHSLTEAGAILPDGSFVYGDNAGFKGLLNYQGNGTEPAEDGKSINVVGMFSAGSNSGNFNGSGLDKNMNYLEYQMIPVPKGPDGQAYSPYSAPVSAGFWFVTTDAEDPDFCVYMGDYFYQTDKSMWVRYGLEEVDWTMDKKFCSDWYTEHTKLIEGTGNKQYIDDYYSIVRLRADAIWGENTSAFWHNQQPRYASLEFFSHATDYFDPETFVYLNGNYGRLSGISKEFYSNLHPKYNLPVIAYTDEEQAAITETQVILPETFEEWVMKFISGEKDPNSDADWQEYLDAIEEIGMSDYIKTTQTAYERSMYYESNFK